MVEQSKVVDGILRKKVCMVGSPGVGKTSLVRRLVDGIFEQNYLSTLGVKIDKKRVEVAGQRIEIILWDLAGSKKFATLEHRYLTGSHGYLLTCDGTRLETVETAVQTQERIHDLLGPVPFHCVINKGDLEAEWAVNPRLLEQMKKRGWPVHVTSAKSGLGVEATFLALAETMVQR